MPKAQDGKPVLRAFKPIQSMAEVGKSWWRRAEPDRSGKQYYTDCLFGTAVYAVMLDTGSGVNSITERGLVELMNIYHALGLRVGSPGCPILWLEDWEHEQRVRGIAAGASVRLLGAVVMRVTLKEKGKSTGPMINVRFKITQSGETDWISTIFGGSLCDDPGLGGIGLVPMKDCHFFRKFNLAMERTEPPSGPRIDEGERG